MSEERYEVIGGCDIDGVPHGEQITLEQLNKAGANVNALLGTHLKKVDGRSKATMKKDTGGDG